MGATSWFYFVPHQADISRALQDLRQDAFRRGEYEHLLWGDTSGDEMNDRYVSHVARSMAQLFRQDPTSVRDPYHAYAELYETLRALGLLEVFQQEDTLKQLIRSSVAKERKRRRSLEPKTIEELLDRNAEEGTHSILDINAVADEPGFAVAAPLTPDELKTLFGTEQPTHEMVEEKIDGVCDLRERWEGTYIIVYEGDVPSEILFAGHSGD